MQCFLNRNSELQFLEIFQFSIKVVFWNFGIFVMIDRSFGLNVWNDLICGFICASIGMLIIFVLNTLMPWRTVALICSAVPILTAISVYFVINAILSFSMRVSQHLDIPNLA